MLSYPKDSRTSLKRFSVNKDGSSEASIRMTTIIDRNTFVFKVKNLKLNHEPNNGGYSVVKFIVYLSQPRIIWEGVTSAEELDRSDSPRPYL